MATTTALPTTTDLLVVGAGPGGLATALTALRHGVRVLVVERRHTTSTIPRATGISTRTMEIVRGWGLTDAVRAGEIDADPTVWIGTTLAESPIQLTRPGGLPTVREVLAASPAGPAAVPQDHIEPLLVAEIRRLGGEVRFATPLVRLHTAPDGVRAELGGDRRSRVRARFVVGADGSRSTVRAALGIGSTRLGTIGDWAQVLFRPDLAQLFGRRMSLIHFLRHPEVGGALLPVGSGRWVYAKPAAAMPTPAEWTAMLRTATGRPDLEPELLRAQQFTMAADVASSYRAGPGFLVGDAAHRMTPAGGVGLNTAVHDGQELGWRIGWVIRGLAGDALLDAWAQEREPVGRANAERSLRMDDHDPADGLPGDLGRTYRSGVIADDGPAAPLGHRTARPGERAPHVWVRRDGRRTSTLDLFEGRLTLLAGSVRWDRPAAGPVRVLVPGRDLDDRSGKLARAYRLGPDSAVLVRPDGVVAWRNDGPCADPGTVLSGALALALGRPLPAAVAV